MDKDKKYNIFQNLGYCLSAAWQVYPWLCAYAAGMIAVNCVVPLITAYLPKVLIDEITGGAELKHVLAVTGGMTLGLALAGTVQKYLERLIYWHKFKLNAFFLRKVTKKGLTTDYKNQEDEHFRKLQNESFASCNGNFSYFNQIMDASVQFFSNLLGFAAFFGILAMLNPLIIVFLALTTLIGFFLNRRINKWVSLNTDEKAGYEQRMQYVISASDDTAAAKDIRLYNMAKWLNDVYDKNLKGVLGWYKKYTAKLFGIASADSAVTLIREGITYLYLLYLVIKEEISVADFVLYFNVVAGFSNWLGSMLGQLSNIERLNLSVNRIREFLDYPENYRREGGKEIPGADEPREIRLDHVSFRYKEDDKDILSNIDLMIKPGEHLAIVGLNGAGKTTLVKLICGLTEADSGTVLYNGTDIREYNRDDYYDLFGAVFQDDSIMPVTLAEIVAEDLIENIDEKRVEICLKQAGLWGRIAELKDGIHSKYDKAFWDEGINLSGGEKQKLMLARALYRRSPLIILDEPTAALDPISENCLYETYDEMMKDKTTVFISHRLASTRFCSRIILMEDGKIAEEGTHEELLKLRGKYYELFETQAKYYRENDKGKEEADEVR
ncbi:MAG: ABC transporter ATP-binding protein [Lachnospiraceae bacterium]|nr:ABC transporter ATP-binding protein [Lachnospiraceae bacterium]